jgi:hypothetical protein
VSAEAVVIAVGVAARSSAQPDATLLRKWRGIAGGRERQVLMPGCAASSEPRPVL